MENIKRHYALAWFAKQWIGTKEEGGNNKGRMVEIFQKAVDGKANSEPWCLCFIQFCLKQIDELFEEMTLSSSIQHSIWKTEHVMTCWNQTSQSLRLQEPVSGSIVIWRLFENGNPTDSGHAGIVVNVFDPQNFSTVEGNTGLADQREGDGVALKNRNINGMGNLKILGFLKPWN